MDMFALFLIAFLIAFTIWSNSLELCAIKNVLKEIRDEMKKGGKN